MLDVQSDSANESDTKRRIFSTLSYKCESKLANVLASVCCRNATFDAFWLIAVYPYRAVNTPLTRMRRTAKTGPNWSRLAFAPACRAGPGKSLALIRPTNKRRKTAAASKREGECPLVCPRENASTKRARQRDSGAGPQCAGASIPRTDTVMSQRPAP